MPVRILLVGAVVLVAAWFTVLHPKTESVETPQLTQAQTQPQTGLGRAVAKAKTVAGTGTTKPATPAATTTAAPAPQAPVAKVPADALAALPKDVAAALSARKLLVLGVISDEASKARPLADDDRYVRRALRKVNRYHGKVFVKPVGINSLSTYGALVNDLNVTQTPSIVVIDRDLKGTLITGYADHVAIDQAIADAYTRRS
jgi:hypothetical protein